MHEVGSIANGKVTGITKFGAFVELDDGTVGMVHISEVSQTYVNDISEHLEQNQEVKVKVLAINDDKKVSLSIKKAMPQQPRNNGDRNYNNNRNDNNRNYGERNNNNNRSDNNRNDFNRNNSRSYGDRNNNNNRNDNNRNDNNRNDNNRNDNNRNYGDRNNRNDQNKGYKNDRNNNKGYKPDKDDDDDYNHGNKKNTNKTTGNNNRNNNNNFNQNNNYFNRNATTPKGPEKFENMLSKFMSSSEDKISNVKKPGSNRRGGHSSKRDRDYD